MELSTYIMIMGGTLFRKVAAMAKLRKDFKNPDKLPRAYDQRTFTLDSMINLEIKFKNKVMKTSVYIKMDTHDQLLLLEGLQLKMMTSPVCVTSSRNDTGDSHPIKQPARWMPFVVCREVARQVQKMQDSRIVVPSSSHGPVQLSWYARKFCRHLNATTKADQFPILRTDDLLDQIGYFSTLDLASGYWEIPCTQTLKSRLCSQLPLDFMSSE